MKRQPKGFYGKWRGRKVRRRWWSSLNWMQGLRFDAVGRYRCCGHTTPFHYSTCTESASNRPVAAAPADSRGFGS